jgi:hypothetical protein
MDAFFVSVVIVVVEMASFVGVIDVRRVKTRRPGAPFWNHNDTTLTNLEPQRHHAHNFEPQRHHAHEFGTTTAPRSRILNHNGTTLTNARRERSRLLQSLNFEPQRHYGHESPLGTITSFQEFCMDAFFVSVVIVMVEMASFVGLIDVRRVKTRRPGAPFWNHNDTTLTNLEPQRHHAHEFCTTTAPRSPTPAGNDYSLTPGIFDGCVRRVRRDRRG